MSRPLKSILVGSVGAAIACTSVSLLPIATVARSGVQVAQRSPEVVFIRRETSGDPGGRYRGGGSRGVQAVCPETAVPLTALVPFEETYASSDQKLPVSVNVWGYTAVDRPTFWVYVPYGNPAIPATFLIQDDATEEPLYETTVKLPKQAGIMGIQLPDSAPALQPGKRYRWFFSVSCKSPAGASTIANRIYVEAVAIREQPSPDLTRQLAADASLANAIAYAKAGFWYDALTTLAKLRQQRPQDEALQTAWKELLTGVATSEQARQNFNLDKISSQPLVK